MKGIKLCALNKSTMPDDNGCLKLTIEGINVDVSWPFVIPYLIENYFAYSLGSDSEL